MNVYGIYLVPCQSWGPTEQSTGQDIVYKLWPRPQQHEIYATNILWESQPLGIYVRECACVCGNHEQWMAEVGWSNGLQPTDGRNSWKSIHQLSNHLKIHLGKTTLEGGRRRSSWDKTNSKQMTGLQMGWMGASSVKTGVWPGPKPVPCAVNKQVEPGFFFSEKPLHWRCRPCLSSIYHPVYEIWPPRHLDDRWKLSECVHIVGINKH